MSGIDAKAISVALGKRPVLAGVDLAVASGEVVGLIGPNGAGKSTLLRVLAGLLAPDRGEVCLAGRPIAGLAAAERARSLAYLPQGTECHWPLSVERLVALGRLPHLAPWSRPRSTDAAAVARALQEADVVELAARPVTALSAGERMRALLARALAGETPVLLADEPVAALDPWHQLQVMQLLAGRAAAGTAVLVVLHELGLAARFCSRLVLLHCGRIVASGDPRAVLSPAHLAATYGVEAEIAEVQGELLVVPWRRIGPGLPP